MDKEKKSLCRLTIPFSASKHLLFSFYHHDTAKIPAPKRNIKSASIEQHFINAKVEAGKLYHEYSDPERLAITTKVK